MVIESGTRLGRYEILAPVGAGGMGEVYRARDSELDREVAIKVLPEGLADDPDRLARFKREAKAVARLSHPNILELFDFGVEGRTSYAVMELLEGRTLRDSLGRSGLGWKRAAEIGAALADGLAAAHEKGVIHRDLKPENIIVTSDDRVKILDFGLARVVETYREEAATASLPPEVTAPGRVMGTVGYMSPEQVRGNTADHRSDVFGLGSVLYEMVEGRRAFARDSAPEVMTAILKEEPPELSGPGAQVPTAFDRVIRRCLEKRPERRFQSASDLAFGLRSVLTESDAPVTPVHAEAEGLRRKVMWVAIAGLLLVTGIVMTRWMQSGSSPAESGTQVAGEGEEEERALDPGRVVVMRFSNQTGDPSLDSIGLMASNWITQGLSRIDGLKVVPNNNVMEPYRRPGSEGESGSRSDDSVRDLAEATRAGTVVGGSYFLQGQHLHFQTQITDATRGEIIYALDPMIGSRDDPMTLVESARQHIMGVVATHFNASMDLTRMSSPPRVDAYREFIAAVELFGTDTGEAIRHLEIASELDPDFLEAQSWLAVACWWSGDNTRAALILRQLEGKWERLTPYQRLFTRLARAFNESRFSEGLRAGREALELAPNDGMMKFQVGMMAFWVNRPSEAIEYFNSLDPRLAHGRDFVFWTLRATAKSHYLLGDFEEELEVLRHARHEFPEDGTLASLEIRALTALGRLGEVDRLIEQSLSERLEHVTPASLTIEAGVELRARGRRKESLEYANRALDQIQFQALGKLSDRARALRYSERWDEARVAYEQLDSQNPGGFRYQGRLGAIAARIGDHEGALRISDQLASVEQVARWNRGWPAYYRACIAAVIGDHERAIALIHEAIEQGFHQFDALHREMDLESLRDYPPFQELIRPKG